MSMNGGSGLDHDPSDYGPLGDPAKGTEGIAAGGLEDDPLSIDGEQPGVGESDPERLGDGLPDSDDLPTTS